MIRTLEAIFRHPLQLLFILVFLPVVGLGIAYILPPSYQATATLWALRRYEVIGSTGAESDLNSSPSVTQTAAITELLQSQTFAVEVAHETQLASSLRLSSSVLNDPQRLDSALFNEISQHVLVTSLGYNLFQISYANPNPVVAQQIVAAVIKHYSTQSQIFSLAEAQRLLQSYNTQYAKAQQDRNAAAMVEAKYASSHPQTDPRYTLLHGQTLQTQAALDSLATVIKAITAQISKWQGGPDTLFTIVDEPVVPTSAVSRLKLFSIAGGTGLGIAVLACALYLLILVRRDHGVYTALDLQKVISIPVIVELPALPSKVVPLVIKQSLH